MLGAALALVATYAVSGRAQTGQQAATDPAAAAALAKQLSNPVASLVSIPFQLNWDEGLGTSEQGRRFVMNFQPVLPFKVNDDWNLIARVITPVIAQPVLFDGGEPAFGMGDILFSAFLSPAQGALVWGVGPVIGLPVTSDPRIGSGKYTLGPTAVVLKQLGPWTVGGLANHVWSVGGDDGRKDVNQTFLQPFVAYGKAGWTFSVNSESLGNWEAASGEEWTIPVNIMLSKVVQLGTRPISVQAGPRFYVETPTGGPDWGFRAALTLIFPRRG